MTFGWDDVDDIAEALIQAHPEVDPLEVQLADLHKWVVDLPDFDSDPHGGSEACLEAIRKAWCREVTD